MGLLHHAAHSLFGDRVPSSEERTLLHEARRLRRRARWANRLSKDTAAARMVNQLALQMTLAYETIREQRYRRLAAKYAAKRCDRSTNKYLHRADCSGLVIDHLQRQLEAYQSLQQPRASLAPPPYSAYSPLQPQQQGAIAAVPINTRPPPPHAAHNPMPAPPAYTARPTHYPAVSQHMATPSSSAQSLSSVSSPSSARSELQEPWLKAAGQRTVY